VRGRSRARPERAQQPFDAARVEQRRDPQQITAWIRRAATVTTLEAVFDEH